MAYGRDSLQLPAWLQQSIAAADVRQKMRQNLVENTPGSSGGSNMLPSKTPGLFDAKSLPAVSPSAFGGKGGALSSVPLAPPSTFQGYGNANLLALLTAPRSIPQSGQAARPPINDFENVDQFQGRRVGSGAGSIVENPLPPALGMGAAPSGPRLSMPVVGEKGLGDTRSAMYGAPPAPSQTGKFLRGAGKVLNALGMAFSTPEQQLAMERLTAIRDQRGRSEDANKRWNRTLEEYKTKVGVPDNVIEAARVKGYYGGGQDIIDTYLTGMVGGQDKPADLVNVLDSETQQVAAVTKPRAAQLAQTYPGRFSIAGSQSLDRGANATETEREVQRLISNGMSDVDARDLAFNRARIFQSPVDGSLMMANMRTGSVSPLRMTSGRGGSSSALATSQTPALPSPPSGGQAARTSQPVQAAQPPEVRLWDLAQYTGAIPSTLAGLSRLSGQIGGPVASKTITGRQMLVNETQGLVRSLANNPRFPVGEMEALKDEISIQPGPLDSEGAMKARMVAINNSLSKRLANERRAGSDMTLPVETRKAALQAANDIQNFLTRLGVPESEAANIPRGKSISQMNIEELQKLDPLSLSDSELREAAARWEQLRGAK